MKGILPELFEDIADRAKIRYELIITRTREEYLARLDKGDIDICIDCHDNYSRAEDLEYKLTDPYLTAGMSWLEFKEFQGKKKRIAVVGNTAFPEELPAIGGDHSFISCDSFKDCLKAMELGQADPAMPIHIRQRKSSLTTIRTNMRPPLLPTTRNFPSVYRNDWTALWYAF